MTQTRHPSNCTTTFVSFVVKKELMKRSKEATERKRERHEERTTRRERACDVGEATVHATRTNGACRRSGYMMREGMLFLAT